LSKLHPTDLEAMESSRALRHELAQERQNLWRDLGNPDLTDRDKTRVADRVIQITKALNGHAHDAANARRGIRPPGMTVNNGGMYEQKRYDRVDMQKGNRTHESYLDKLGDDNP
jgi:hypothetical protein